MHDGTAATVDRIIIIMYIIRSEAATAVDKDHTVQPRADPGHVAALCAGAVPVLRILNSCSVIQR